MPIPLPASIILAAASVLLIFGRRHSVGAIRVMGVCSLLCLFIAAISLLYERPLGVTTSEALTAPAQVWSQDPLAAAEQWLVLLYAVLAGVSVFDSIRQGQAVPATLGFFLFVIAGIILCVQANDLLSLGLCFEIIDLAGNTLRKQTDPNDVVGRSSATTFASRLTWLVRGWLWLGIALIANATSNTNFEAIRLLFTNAYTSSENPSHIGSPSKLVLLAAGFIIISLVIRLLFSVLQTTVLTTTEQKPTTLSPLLAVGQQLVVTSVLTRIVGTVFTGLSHSLTTLLMAATFVSFAASCLFVFRGQTPGAKSIPRFTAALGLLQAGWFVIALMIAATELDNREVRLGAFRDQHETLAVIVLIQSSWLLAGLTLVGIWGHLQRANRELLFIEDVRGLWAQYPLATLMITAAVASLIGFPLSAGFWSRWFTFLAGSNVHWKSTSMILTPFEGLRLTMLLGIVATIVNAALVVNLIRELFLETPLGRPQVTGGRPSYFASIAAASICIVIGTAPQIILNPLQPIRPPAFIPFNRHQNGSGTTPVGRNEDVRSIHRHG